MSQEKKIYINNEDTQCNTNCDSQELNHSNKIEKNNELENYKEKVNSVFTKIPIVLSVIEVEIGIETEFKLKKSATYVKTVNKHTIITECNLIPYTNKLFVEGYVQKSIYFYCDENLDKAINEGNLKHTTINIPFKSVTKVVFQNEPIYGEVYRNEVMVKDDKIVKNKDIEQSWVHYNKPYEKVYCDIDYIKIMETDFLNAEDCTLKDIVKKEQCTKLTIKMVVYIGLKVLQKQAVSLSSSAEVLKLIGNIIENIKEHEEGSK